MRWTNAVFLCLTGLTFAGCGQRNPASPEGIPGTSAFAPLPPGAYLDSAKLLLNVRHAQGQAVVVHPQQAPWSEPSVTWSQIGPALSPFVLATFRPRDTGWVRVDVTGLLKLWLDGVWANHGIVLDQNAPEFLRTSYHSRESRSKGPRLVLYFSIPGSSPVFAFEASADASIDAASPLSNFGADSVLQTGWTAAEPGERRTLIAFDLTEQEKPAPSRLGDRVWLDLNQNGIQDESEPGVPGVSVSLFDCQDKPLAQTVTDSSGHYLFDSLEAGSYVVRIDPPEGHLLAIPHQGESDQHDSDVDSSGRSGCIALAKGEENRAVDAGLFRRPAPKSAVGDRVWLDANKDGLQDSDEQGLAGVEVSLLDCEGSELASSVTDVEGRYLFAELEPGHYRLRFDQPEGLLFSVQMEGDWERNSDADPRTGLSECIELEPGEEDLTRDAGLHEPEPQPELMGSLGDRVWLDANRNGLQDEGEAGVPAVGVVLKRCEGEWLAETTTDADGRYRFDSLPAGSYRLMFLIPEEYELSPQGAGPDRGKDSDPDPASAMTACIELAPGEANWTYDAGLHEREAEPVGCTHSRSVWKKHSRRDGDPDWVSGHLPIRLGAEGGVRSLTLGSADSTARLLGLCIMGGYANGITRLYAELLAARLNEATGASTDAVQHVLELADQFLAGTSWKQWCDLSETQQSQTHEWRRALASWNEGRTGPGACPP